DICKPCLFVFLRNLFYLTVLAFGQNVCTAQKRRQPEGRLGALSEPFAGSENIQIGVQFHKNRSFRLKRAALFLGEKEPPAILVGFPHML
ncbi:hypothetical protein LIR33_12490, partial [Flavonifractor plautii]|uniref:hypothetical protein n=1 Tax=Flavonifractor plautii TaxID=292800 RepID=UPI001D034B68